MDVHPQPIDLAGSLKLAGSDDDLFGGSTTDFGHGDVTELSSSEDVGGCPRMPQLMHNMPGGMAILPPSMMPMAPTAMPGPHAAMPMTMQPLPIAANGPQMYFLSMAPDGSQILVPVSQTQMPTWGPQMLPASPLNQRPDNTGTSEFSPPVDGDSCAGSLEARAAALSAYAAEVKAEARKAKAAAAAAARRGRTTETPTHKTERASSDLSTPRSERWADITDTGFHCHADDNDEIPNDDRTTLMFRNLPNNYNRSTLLHMLDTEGFKATYNLVYLPTDFRNFAGFGYAFVNFVTHHDAKKAKQSFQGFSRWRVPSRKTCDVVWSGPVQGLQAHTERYRNSPVMHDSVPDEYKPAVFVDGVRVPFPAPTKRIRPPRVRRNSATDGCGIASPVPDHVGGSKRSGRGKVQ